MVTYEKIQFMKTERTGIADSGWRGVSFVGGTKTTLARVLGEKGVVLTAKAQARLDALPDDWRAVAGSVGRAYPPPGASCRANIPPRRG